MTCNSILGRCLRRGVAIASLSQAQIKLIENTVNKLVGLRLNSLNTDLDGKKYEVVIMIGF
ncbi:hypothetical protein VB713_05755 [Anabaena cylindrica UHCC 0172]|nr:hypothetical protein [Anabaena cylindrica UHCC 0172]